MATKLTGGGEFNEHDKTDYTKIMASKIEAKERAKGASTKGAHLFPLYLYVFYALGFDSIEPGVSHNISIGLNPIGVDRSA